MGMPDHVLSAINKIGFDAIIVRKGAYLQATCIAIHATMNPSYDFASASARLEELAKARSSEKLAGLQLADWDGVRTLTLTGTNRLG